MVMEENMKKIWALFFLGEFLFVVGCDVKKITNKPILRHANYISVSSVPLIQQVLEKNTPLFQGRTNANIMKLVCQYVSGDIPKETFDEYFKSRHVDIAKLAEQDHGFRFLANQTKGNYEKGCASYIASKFFSYEMLTLDENISDIDTLTSRLKQLTPTVLKVSHYIAEIAAVKNKKYNSVSEFKGDVEYYISMNSKEFIYNVMHEKYEPTMYSIGGGESGITYEIKGDGIRVYIYGELWLGQGKAMGTEYKVSIKSREPYG